MKSLEDLRLDDFRLELKGRSLVPIMQGGMGVNISTAEMAQAVAARGGIGHVSDAMVPDLADRLFGTGFTRMKALACKALERTTGEAGFHFPVEKIREAAKLYLGRVMEGRTGEGRIHVNIMEKLTMNASLETLRARLLGALDAGVDGISLSAGLHAGSFALMSGHPRFRDACLGVVVSSRRALNLFMRKSAKTGRLPDYVVVEGPLAGGHLGFGADWQRFSLADIVRDVKGWLHENALRIPVIAAGGVFTGTDGVRMITEAGADGIQAATRFAVTRESGLPDVVKQRYFDARAEDIEVNGISPTGYPMRMLKSSPAINAALKPQCAAYGYMLDHGGWAGLRGLRGSARGCGNGAGRHPGEDLPLRADAQLTRLDARCERGKARGGGEAGCLGQVGASVDGGGVRRLPFRRGGRGACQTGWMRFIGARGACGQKASRCIPAGVNRTKRTQNRYDVGTFFPARRPTRADEAGDGALDEHEGRRPTSRYGT